MCVSVCQSGGGSPQSQRPAELSDDEVGELFQRLAEVQQEKWMLEEKVRRLLCYHGNHVSVRPPQRRTLAASSALLRLMLRVDSRVSSEKLGLFLDELLISVQ